MKLLSGVIRFLIPFTVLYTIGYYVAGFSALTIGWLVLLAVLIAVIDWMVLKLLGKGNRGLADRRPANRLIKVIITFLVAATVIFTATLAIAGGNVPLEGALLAAGIIAVLSAWLLPKGERSGYPGRLR